MIRPNGKLKPQIHHGPLEGSSGARVRGKSPLQPATTLATLRYSRVLPNVGTDFSSYFLYTASRTRANPAAGMRRLVARRSRLPDRGRVAAYPSSAMRTTVRADNPAARAVRSTGYMSSSVRLVSRSVSKMILMLRTICTTSTRMRRIARTMLRGDCAAVSVEDIATRRACGWVQGRVAVVHTQPHESDRGRCVGGTTATIGVGWGAGVRRRFSHAGCPSRTALA